MVMAASPSYGQRSYGVVYQPGQSIPISQMYPSGTAAELKISNKPASPQAEANLHVLRPVLMALPVAYNLNSAYRAPAVNKAVGGAGGYCSAIPGTPYYSANCSQHTSALAADVTPTAPGWDNQRLAAWFYENRKRFSNLDKVIWYRDTSHVHFSLGPRARAHKDLPGGFYTARKEGSQYTPWKPSPGLIAAVQGAGAGVGFTFAVAAAIAVGVYLASR